MYSFSVQEAIVEQQLGVRYRDGHFPLCQITFRGLLSIGVYLKASRDWELC